MSKIMFVEDELSSNIPRLLQLFGKYLSEAEKTALQDAENNPMGANGEDIREILADNLVIEVFDSFKQVLAHIQNLTPDELEKYDMFILDRNLTRGMGYSLQEIQQIDKGFDNNKYWEREGDYLALQLHLKDCPIKEKVFFYSAYKTMGFGATEIEQMVGYGTFFLDNFFDKGNPGALIELINHQQRASLFAEHRDVFGIIAKADLGIEEAVMRILLEAQKADAKLTMDWRTAIDACLKYMVNYERFWFTQPYQNIERGKLIGMLDRGDEKADPALPGRTPAHIRDFFEHINHIVNVYPAHNVYEDKLYSPYTVKALAYELLEIITWIGANCK